MFRSPWYPPQHVFEQAYFPHGLLQTWFYPFWWTSWNAWLVTEVVFRDARLALTMLAVPVLAACLPFIEAADRRRSLALIAAAVIGYVAWLRLFSILRYAVALEAFAAVLLVATLHAATRQAPARLLLARLALPGWCQPAPVLAAALLAALVLHTRYPDWLRIPYGERVWDIEAVTLPPDSLVVTLGGGVSMILPYMDAPGLRAVGITRATLEARGWRLYDEVTRMIRTHQGPIFMLMPAPSALERLPADLGLVVDAGQCRPLHANITCFGGMAICPARLRAASGPQSVPAPR